MSKRVRKSNAAKLIQTNHGFTIISEGTGKTLAKITFCVSSREKDKQAFVVFRVSNASKTIDIDATVKTMNVTTVKGKQ